MENEAEIIVNGHKLTVGESMTVRVALTDIHSRMRNPNHLGTDDMGRSITKGYRDNAWSALKKIIPDLR